MVSLFGGPGRTMPRRVRTGRTIGDCSPSAWTSGTGRSRNHTPPNQSLSILRHYSCRPRQSSTVPGLPRRPSPYPTLTCLTLQGPPSCPKTAVLPLGRPRRTIASCPVPSGAHGNPPGRLRTLSCFKIASIMFVIVCSCCAEKSQYKHAAAISSRFA